MRDIDTNIVKLYIGVLVCILLSTGAVLAINNNDLKYEQHISNYYQSNQLTLSTKYDRFVILKNAQISAIPVVPFNIKYILIVAAIFIIGTMVIFSRAIKSALGYMLGVICVLFMQWWLVYNHIIYLPVLEILSLSAISFGFIYTLKKLLYNSSAKSLPIDAVIKFINNIVNLDAATSYPEYMLNNRKQIEKSLSAVLIHPAMTRDSRLVQRLADENHRNKKFVDTQIMPDENLSGTAVLQTRTRLYKNTRYLAFIPLPVFDKDEEDISYTVIGLTEKIGAQRASYMSTMIFSMYIYFRAKHERGAHQKIYFSMLSLMISVIDAKDPVTAGHSQRVADISRDIGKWMHLSKSQMFDLEFASLMHDIGKIGVSDYVLNKPSVFTQNDFEQMKNHTVRGADMLEEVGISANIVDGVRHHHERIDGRGYPDGICGDELNTIAKILKIADVYDALTSKRQYKEAWKIDKALNILYCGRGKEFDSEIADVFIKHMAPADWIPPMEPKIPKNHIDAYMDKALSIAVDFYHKYSSEIDWRYHISSHTDEPVNLSCENGFMSYDWGETFNNSDFLEEKPLILAYEKSTQSLVFGQKCTDDNVENIYYYFFKGFVNLGVMLLKRNKVRQTLEELSGIYGEPIKVSDQFMAYKYNKIRIIFYHTNDDKCLLYYVPEYMCANYVFESEKTDTMCS